MKYALIISETAEADLDQIIEETQDKALFDAMDARFDELASDPVSIMRQHPEYSTYPYMVGSHGRYVFLAVFRFMEDEKKIEILAVTYIKV